MNLNFFWSRIRVQTSDPGDCRSDSCQECQVFFKFWLKFKLKILQHKYPLQYHHNRNRTFTNFYLHVKVVNPPFENVKSEGKDDILQSHYFQSCFSIRRRGIDKVSNKTRRAFWSQKEKNRETVLQLWKLSILKATL